VLTRRRGMLEIISVSALDLFASALGAFMLLTLVMMPFWLKRPSLDQARAGAEAKLAVEARAAESTARVLAEARAEAQTAEQGLAHAESAHAAALQHAARAAARSGAAPATPASPPSRAGAIRIGDLDVVFVMDTTGSMRPALEDVQASLLGIVRVLGRLSPRLRVGFVAYRDRGEAYLSRETPLLSLDRANTTALIDFVRRLRAQGGGDRPEALAGALKVALTMRWRSNAAGRIVVIGDAPAHPSEAETALELARRFAGSASSATVSRRVSTILTGGDSEAAGFFARLAAAGDGEASRYHGQMIETVLMSILDPDPRAAP
jgi:hypothetical protein